MSDFETIELEIAENGVARLTLNRPDAKNAMSQQMIDELAVATRQLRDNAAARLVVLG
ncbi:MAG: enoyl-CoA hydratase, partial [Planctomycetaceae bacterium]|nr:enoyl-CoA hydratase [Planctomycetaceae bacterium]